jgi:hypothetical protein
MGLELLFRANKCPLSYEVLHEDLSLFSLVQFEAVPYEQDLRREGNWFSILAPPQA